MRRVLKLGGSLLTHPDFVGVTRQWLRRHPARQTVVIVGGGKMIDAVRELDRIRPTDVRRTHWMCVAMLDHTMSIVSQWFPEWQTVETPAALTGWLAGDPATGIVLASVSSFYSRGGETEGLPEDWRTTTDSLAAMLANRIDADELVLAKSCRIEPGLSIRQMVQRGVVDPAFWIDGTDRPRFASTRVVSWWPS